jgi:hypothetical protein
MSGEITCSGENLNCCNICALSCTPTSFNRGFFVIRGFKGTLSAAIVPSKERAGQVKNLCAWLQFTATFKLLAVNNYLARISRSSIEQVCFRRSHKFTLLINAQGRSKSFSCMYFLYLLSLIRWNSMVMHLISSFSTSILSWQPH